MLPEKREQSRDEQRILEWEDTPLNITRHLKNFVAGATVLTALAAGTATADAADKHKIFLYKEDFDKFFDGLQDAINEIDRLKASGEYGNGPEQGPREGGTDAPPFSDVNFEDLDRKDI